MNLSGDALDDVKHVCWVEDEHIAQKPSYSHQVPKVGQWYINAVVVGKASFFFFTIQQAGIEAVKIVRFKHMLQNGSINWSS